MTTLLRRETNAYELRVLKAEVSQAKHRLIEIEKEVRKLSEKEADRLASIISRLEGWQQ